MRHLKVLANRADIETSIDLSILSEETLNKMSGYNQTEFDSHVKKIDSVKAELINRIDTILQKEKFKNQDNILNMGEALKILLGRWDDLPVTLVRDFHIALREQLNLEAPIAISNAFAAFKKPKIKVELPILTNSDTDAELIVCDRELEVPDGYIVNTAEEYEVLLEAFQNKKYKKDIKWNWKEKEIV